MISKLLAVHTMKCTLAIVIRTTAKNASTYYSHDVLRTNTY